MKVKVVRKFVFLLLWQVWITLQCTLGPRQVQPDSEAIPCWYTALNSAWITSISCLWASWRKEGTRGTSGRRKRWGFCTTDWSYMLTTWEQWEINKLECLLPLMSVGKTRPPNYSAWLTLVLHTVSWLLQMPGVGTRNDSALGQDSPLSGPHPCLFPWK